MTRFADAVESLLQIALAWVGILVLVGEEVGNLALWCLLAIIYLIMRSVRSNGSSGAWLPQSKIVRRLRMGFAILASLVGLTGALTIVFNDTSDDMALINRGVAVPMVLLAWGVLHFAFADVYRAEQWRAQQAGTELPFQFAGSAPVEPSDFVYFAFTVGTTFATSDVEVTTPAARRVVTRHSVLAFLYNTAILGTAVGLITGG